MVEVSAALIWDPKGRFLICQRPAHKARGMMWEFVGGKAEPGEKLEDTLIRECREELDVTVNPTSIFAQLIHEYPDITIRLTLFNAVIVEGQPKMLEHNDIQWIYPSQIPDFTFCPADEDILKLLLAQN
jgi:8-oxo-dGTP diphosphatase